MLLTVVKRLKVASLRAMLTERGLDSRGLKAELVVRLISAIEADTSGAEGGNGGETTSIEPRESPSPASEQCVRTRSPECTSPPKNSMTAYTDQSTQTDPLPLCSCTAPMATAEAVISREQRQHPVALATEDAESGCSSSSVSAISEAAQQQEQCKSSMTCLSADHIL